jgi:malonyl CoA-acyl carrier protein transacylase
VFLVAELEFKKQMNKGEKMTNRKEIAVVGLGAILPDAFDVPAFWDNITRGKYSISEVPSDRWNTELYYDPDPSAVDKTYAKIGAFVRGYQFDPLKSGMPIPPKVLAVMDPAQQWAIAASQQALQDYGYPARPLDPDRVAVIFGNSNAGEGHYRTTFRILTPEYLAAMNSVPEFLNLPLEVRESIKNGVLDKIRNGIPVITEDTMPGELSNIIAGRVANVFNFTGPNYVTDAACASSLAALQGAISGLVDQKFDAVLTGGIDRNMGPESYIKFSKIGALSADGSRPYADGANGFVMGEGAVVFLLKRLADAERDGDKIYAVIRGIGGSSDGKGKGITAPNPLGQQRAMERAWMDAGVSPETVGLIEGHGTSTKVGDVTEVNSLNMIFGSLGLKKSSVVLGSVKSNIGHLKSAAGAAGLLKTILSLHHHVLPPTVNFVKPNPNIDFNNLPFRVSSQSEEWETKNENHRIAGVSSFGFGGTNFHVVLEEYFPGVAGSTSASFSVPERISVAQSATLSATPASSSPVSVEVGQLQGADFEKIKQYVLSTVSEKTGYPVEMLDLELDLEADLGIDTVKQAELFATVRTNYNIPRREDLRLSDYNTLAKVVGFVQDALGAGSGVNSAQSSKENPSPSNELQSTRESNSIQQDGLKPYQGLFFASAQSNSELKSIIQSQLDSIKSGASHVSLCPTREELERRERIAIDYATPEELVKRLEKTITALENENAVTWKALQAHGVYHGSGTPGKVAFLFPGQGSQYVNMLLDLRDTEPVVHDTFDEADSVLTPILGKPLTSFIYTNGTEEELKEAEQQLKDTTITQPAMLTADVAVMRVLKKYGLEPDFVIGHSLGEYAALVAAGVLTFAEALEVVSARGREMSKIKVDDPGCMAAVSAPLENVEAVINAIDDYVVIANINSPVQCVLGGTTKAIDTAIAKFISDGFQAVKIPVSHAFHTKIVAPASEPLREVIARMDVKKPSLPIVANVTGEIYPNGREEILDILANQVASPVQFVKSMQTLYSMGVRVFIESGPKRVLNALATDNLKDKDNVTIIATNHPRKGGKASFNEALCGIYAAGLPASEPAPEKNTLVDQQVPLQAGEVVANIPSNQPGKLPVRGSVVITGAGLGLPGRNHHVFDDTNITRILDGDMRIEQLTEEARQAMLEKHVTRLVKSEAGAVMEEITDLDQVLKLAGQGGEFDLANEFGVPQERVESLDVSSQLAIAAGIEALRDAGIPLVMAHKKTTKGTYLPDRWKLPESMQDETGVIFGSAFPGLNRMAEEADRYYESKMLERQLLEVQSTIELVNSLNPSGQTNLQNDLERRKLELESRIKEINYLFDRRFVFRILSMGHSQFAEYIGARGPNTHVNAACATTTHAVSVAEDWIRSGRCRRVIVIAGDDVTNDTLISWIGTSLFASGAATTEGNLQLAAIPFDKRRNGMIMGMGAAALVIESEDAARERGVRAIGEILATNTANSAFHGTRLDVQHVSEVMEKLLTTAEERFGIRRHEIARDTVFMSHETYTPARGGSASAEIRALRQCFKETANQIIIANTKGFTGHTMGVGIEDVVVVKALETGKVPPIAHIHEGFEPDPELGDLNLSKGGNYEPQYALRLGAGFGSQIAMSLIHKVPGVGERINKQKHQAWLAAVTGYDQADLEVVQRTLRVKSQGIPTHEPAKSTWEYGQVPSAWVSSKSTLNTSSSVLQATRSEGATSALPEPTIAVEKITAPIETSSTSVSNPKTEEIKTYVLSVVSEKTGYPIEMLDLDLDLEADLGIDTVKQAELFATIRANYGIPRREDLILANYNTLQKVIGFFNDNLSTTPAVEEKVVEQPPLASTTPSISVEASTSSAQFEEIKTHVLLEVSEKTGYPMEMLDLDLDLEADLGIDTVKQAELFAAIRTHYGIPRREDLILADYSTLSKVIGFVQDNLKNASQETEEAQNASTDPLPGEQLETQAQETQATVTPISRRVPVPVLFPKIDLCVPTNVELENNHVVVVGDNGNVGLALEKKLKSVNARVSLVKVPDAAEKVAELTKAGDLAGVYFLAAVDADPDWNNSTIDDWSNARSERVITLYHIARALPETAFLISATRMGGLHGFYNPENPLGGVVTGFTKSLRRERRGQFAKVVDFHKKTSASKIAEILISETFRDPVSAEVGYENDMRFGMSLKECPFNDTGSNTPLRDGSVYLVSGGTGGITGSVLTDLAKSSKGTFYLLGRTVLPAKDDVDILSFTKDRSAFRSDLINRLNAAGEKITPVQLEQKLSAIERAASTLKVIADIESYGSKAVYLNCDVTDTQSVIQAVDEIGKNEKSVDVFIHAAGLETSRKLESKPLDEFQKVISVKADGFWNLFKTLESKKLIPSSIVFFSSVAGRFGNAGQTDYSAANDMLSKYCLWLPKQYPGLKAISIDWGAWAEVGMASRGNIPMLMERAGIEMLKPSLAAPMVRKELESESGGEVVIAGSLGILEKRNSDDSGLDVKTADDALRAGNPIHSMFSHLVGFDANSGIRLEAEINPEENTYLLDHAINGVPVLPGVMGIEGFTVAARHISSVLASESGSIDVERLENIQFLAPIKFYDNKPRKIGWNAVAYRTNEGLKVDVRLESDITRLGGKVEHTLHFTGTVYLTAKKLISEVVALPPKWTKKQSVKAEDIYKVYFHGPAFQVLHAAQLSDGKILGEFNKNLVKVSADEPALFATPLLIELCFQTAGLFEAGATGTLGLPQSIGKLKIYKQPLNGVAVFAEVKTREENGKYSFDARVIDAKGHVYLELTDYQTSPMPNLAEKDLVEPLKVLVPVAGKAAN